MTNAGDVGLAPADGGKGFLQRFVSSTSGNPAVEMIRERGKRAGAVINPSTPVETLSEVMDRVDYILAMSVNPGFGGQSFIPNSLEKIRKLRQMRERYNVSFRIEVDGGVDLGNVAQIVRAGAQILVAGTSIFHTADPAAAVHSLKQAATEALAQKV